MRGRVITVGFIVSLLALLGGATLLHALGGIHPPGPIAASHPDWPKGLLGVVNREDRFFGYWVNANDYFCYRGETEGLNRFLQRCGAITGSGAEVVIHGGACPIREAIGERIPQPIDWQLSVLRRGWGAPLDPDRPEEDPGYSLRVDVWLGSRIDLARLEVPATMNVRSGGEIERFVESHREGRSGPDPLRPLEGG